MTDSESTNLAPLCGGCRKEGHCRFGIGALTLNGDMATAPVRCAALFHAGPNVAHGGWIAAVMDDLVGRALMQRGARAVTASLSVDFLKPVPVEEDLEAQVVIGERQGRRWIVGASLRLARGSVDLARAQAVMIERRPTHFQSHEAKMQFYRSSSDAGGDEA
jgi:acyl-coenzyme A thioesterase PaaI-like protein